MSAPTPQSFVRAAIAAEREQWTGRTCDYIDTPRCPMPGCLHPLGDCAEQAPIAPQPTRIGWIDKRDLPWLVMTVLCFVVIGIAEVLG